MREAQPVSRAEAYTMMARMAQDMCNEVDYNEGLIAKNRVLKDKVEKLEKEIEKLKTEWRNEFNRHNKELEYWKKRFYDATGTSPEEEEELF